MRGRQSIVYLASVLLVCSCTGAEAKCAELETGRTLQERHIACYGYPGLDGLLGPWMPYNLDIKCRSSAYKVYVVPELGGNATEVLWCGLPSLNDSTVCHLKLSSRQPSYVTIKGSSAPSCTWGAVRGPDVLRAALAVGGAGLFLAADSLTMSEAFRLSAGSALFMSGAILLLLMLTLRTVPQKRALVAALTVSASTAWGVVRWVYGTWMPSWQAVLTSRPMVWYLILSGLLGLGITYYFDDLGNVKVNNIIKVTLKLTGLLLLYNGSTDDVVSLGMVAALGLGSLLLPHMWPLAQWLSRALWCVLTKLAAASGKAASTATSKLRRASDHSLIALRANKSLSLDAWGQKQAQAEVDRQVAPRRRRSMSPQQGNDFSFQSPAAPQRSPGQSWRVLRAGSPPPPSPPSAYVAPDAWMDGAGSVPAAPEPAAAAAAARSPKPAPFSQERTVLDVTKAAGRTPPSGTKSGMQLQDREINFRSVSRTPPAAKQAGSSRMEEPAGGSSSDHPLIQQGKVVNPLTQKPIDMNKGTFNTLVSQGYRVDRQAGIMVRDGDGEAEEEAPASQPRRRTPARSGGGRAR